MSRPTNVFKDDITIHKISVSSSDESDDFKKSSTKHNEQPKQGLWDGTKPHYMLAIYMVTVIGTFSVGMVCLANLQVFWSILTLGTFAFLSLSGLFVWFVIWVRTRAAKKKMIEIEMSPRIDNSMKRMMNRHKGEKNIESPYNRKSRGIRINDPSSSARVDDPPPSGRFDDSLPSGRVNDSPPSCLSFSPSEIEKINRANEIAERELHPPMPFIPRLLARQLEHLSASDIEEIDDEKRRLGILRPKEKNECKRRDHEMFTTQTNAFLVVEVSDSPENSQSKRSNANFVKVTPKRNVHTSQPSTTPNRNVHTSQPSTTPKRNVHTSQPSTISTAYIVKVEPVPSTSMIKKTNR